MATPPPEAHEEPADPAKSGVRRRMMKLGAAAAAIAGGELIRRGVSAVLGENDEDDDTNPDSQC
ncbi:hypothetical protein ACXZ65_13870 [Streptomyces aculeolatus]